MGDDFRHQATAFHEVDMFWWFTDRGLKPYWALTKFLLDADGWIETDLKLGDEVWHVSLGYHKSGIQPRESDPINSERLYELDLKIEGPGQAHAWYGIRPRFDGMKKASDGEEASIPWCGGEGVDVHAEGSNLTFDEYHYLLQKAIQALAEERDSEISRRYFNRPRPDSKIVTTELYVRLMREYAKKLTRADGAFYRLMHLMSTKDNATWSYSGENEDGVQKRHTFEVEPDAAQELGPAHSLGRRLKCYHPKYVRNEETNDDPLSSPKFGVAFHRSLNSSEAVLWKNRNDLLQELEETVVNVLRWAGIPIDPDPTVFREDNHFSVGPSERKIARLQDPTPKLEAEQDLLIMRVLDDLMPASKEVTKELATDGGQHVGEVAEETGYSLSQVYRALQQLGDLVKNENGVVQLASEKIRQSVAGMVDNLEREVVSKANRIAHLCNVEARSAADSALQKWMNEYGVNYVADSGGDGEGTLRFDTILSELKSAAKPALEEVLQEGLDAWTSAGRDATTFQNLQVEVDLETFSGTVHKTGRVRTLH